MATFHNVPITEVVPADLNAVIYPTLSQIALPGIMQEKVDGSWLDKLMVTMPLAAVIASPCSATKFTYINNLLAQQAKRLDDVSHTALYKYSQLTALAAALKAYGFLTPWPHMLFPEHHW
uniref:Uncharacterized protein n=1 Tax=Romanomermis culicivorax TaxID=13658 RepID=A0A915K3C6_ROMCU